jgi:hypothetical protein
MTGRLLTRGRVFSDGQAAEPERAGPPLRGDTMAT